MQPLRPVDLVGIGGTKCGSTSLWGVLRGQPWFAASVVKETRYFSDQHGRGPEWYRAQFPDVVEDRLLGEVTPAYLHDPGAPFRIASHNSDARVFAILRDPVTRFASHVGMERGAGRLDASVSVLELLTAERWRRTRSPLLELGEYGRHLERYLEHFPREQLHVLFLEEVLADPAGQLGPWLHFLAPAQRSQVPRELPHWNSAFVPRSRRIDRALRRLVRRSRASGRIGPVDRLEIVRRRLARPGPPSDLQLDPASRAILAAHYAPLNGDLGGILGRPPPASWTAA